MRRATIAIFLSLAVAGGSRGETGSASRRDPCDLKGKTFTFTWDEGARVLAGPYPERWLLESGVVASPGSRVQGSWQRVDQARAAMAMFMEGLREPLDVVEVVTPVPAGDGSRAPLAGQPEVRLGVSATINGTPIAPEHVTVGVVEDESGERAVGASGKTVFEVRFAPAAAVTPTAEVRVTYRVFDQARWLKLGPDTLKLLCQGDTAAFETAKRVAAGRVNVARELCFACGADLVRPGGGHTGQCWLQAGARPTSR